MEDVSLDLRDWILALEVIQNALVVSTARVVETGEIASLDEKVGFIFCKHYPPSSMPDCSLTVFGELHFDVAQQVLPFSHPYIISFPGLQNPWLVYQVLCIHPI